MTDYVHIMPKNGKHSDMGAAGCHCEPEIFRIKDVPWVRVVVHQGVNKLQLNAELKSIFEAFPGKELI